MHPVNVVDIAAWLGELGLERYAQAFRENAIDAEVLPELTDADLEKLGILLGHRKKLLKAIAMLQAGEAAPAAPAKAAAQAPRESRRATEAERRQLTVLICDLVGSTDLTAKLDPEDMGQVIRAYQECCAQVVRRWDGHIAKYLGDGVLTYFGYPKAHEDDAERAVRAGLELVHAVGELAAPSGGALAARVGVATGPVVVGDLIGEGAAREAAVVGETPNLAARLQVLAEPGTVVIAPGTRRLVAGLFELADLGARELKGFATPVRAWRVLGPSRVEGRFEAREAAGLLPLVGREGELTLLLRRWEQAKDGEGQVVLLSGEAGAHGALRVVFMRVRIPEIDQDPVAHVLGDEAGKKADCFGHGAVITDDDLSQIFGIDARGQRGGADQIAEHYGKLPPLRFSWNRRCGGRRGEWGGRFPQCSDRRQQPPPVPDRGDSDCRQVLSGQLTQDLLVDVVVGERRCVLRQV